MHSKRQSCGHQDLWLAHKCVVLRLVLVPALFLIVAVLDALQQRGNVWVIYGRYCEMLAMLAIPQSKSWTGYEEKCSPSPNEGNPSMSLFRKSIPEASVYMD